MVIKASAVAENTPATDIDTLPSWMVRTVPAPRVWIFVESADASCDLDLVGGWDTEAGRLTQLLEGGDTLGMRPWIYPHRGEGFRRTHGRRTRNERRAQESHLSIALGQDQ